MKLLPCPNCKKQHDELAIAMLCWNAIWPLHSSHEPSDPKNGSYCGCEQLQKMRRIMILLSHHSMRQYTHVVASAKKRRKQ